VPRLRGPHRPGPGRDGRSAGRARRHGRAIDTLIIDRDHVLGGTVGDDGSVVFDESAHSSSYGIIYEIARRVLQSGGRVLSVETAMVPSAQPLVAILRYAF
jgi:hypothetical protein